MVHLAAQQLGGSRLLGDVGQDLGRSRKEFSKPLALSADQLLSSGPKGGPGSVQDKRHRRILKTQALLQEAVLHVVEQPQKIHRALTVHEDLGDAPSCVLHAAKKRLGGVITERLKHAFLEASLAGARTRMRTERMHSLRESVQWANKFKERICDESKSSLQHVQLSSQALDAVEKAQELQNEARARAAQDASMGEGQRPRSGSRRSKAAAALAVATLPKGLNPRPAEVIVAEAMAMLRQWKHHEEVAYALCCALMSMAEVCGDDFMEEMGRKGLGVLASTVADMWSSNERVCRIALRLLSLMSIELTIGLLLEFVECNAMVTTLGLEALNKLCKDKSQDIIEEVAFHGGREYIQEVEKHWSHNSMIALHASTLRRRLRTAKVRSQHEKIEVEMPPDEILRMKGMFEALDPEGTGEIGPQEFALAFQMMGMKLDSRELRDAWAEVDTDFRGFIVWPQFLLCMSQFGKTASLESKFTAERLAELREVFSLFDDDGNGSLDPGELRIVMRSVGLTPTDKEITDMIAEVDSDGSGCIDWPEFLFLMSKQVIKPDEQHRFAFEFFDQAKEGRIQRGDFIRQMRTLSKDFTEQELDEMFQEAKFEDPDMYSMTYKEFVKMMMR